MSKQVPETISIWDRLPSIVWIFIFIFGIIGFVAVIIGIFYALSHFEGFGSLLFLIIGWAILRAGSSPPAAKKQAEIGGGFLMAIGITFFALMGMAVDQPGNPIYNYPISFFCPDGTEMSREVDVSHPRAGTTQVTQDFSCYDTETGEFVEQIGMGKIIVLRFFEYVLLGYLLVGLSRLYDRFKYRRMREAHGGS